MGFADRFREAAEAARDNVVDHAVHHNMAAVGVPHTTDPDLRDLDAARRAEALGAPDPYSLITHDEVVALTGLPVGGPSLTSSDDGLGVRFDAEGHDAEGGERRWSFAVHAGHAVDETTAFDPGRWYAWMTGLLPDAEQVSVGDRACYRDGLLYVLSQERAFYVQVEAPEGSPTREWALRLGGRVVARFASGVAG